MDNKLIFRIACLYRRKLEEFARVNKEKDICSLPKFVQDVKRNTNELEKWVGQLAHCQTHSWSHAYNYLSNNMIQGMLQSIQGKAGILERKICGDSIKIPRIKDLMPEIKSLTHNFTQVRFRRGKLSVLTDRIKFEDIDLGRFKIIFDFNMHLSECNYEDMISIQAKSPNPAAEDTNVTHPHVKDNRPCLGEALPLIQEAFVQGRLESFFMILDSMLKTYNPGSPYVAIRDWENEGYICGRCDERMPRDEMIYCDSCEREVCENCQIYCRVCDYYGCMYCVSQTCTSCNRNLCHSCSQYACEDCGEDVCEDCVSGCCNNYCEECASKCSECETTICESCDICCPACDKYVCGECNVPCAECGASRCKSCAIECEGCEDVLCKSCIRKCENCNEYYCQDCYDEIDECSLLKEKV